MNSAFTRCHPMFTIKCFSAYFECTAVQSFEPETCLPSQPMGLRAWYKQWHTACHLAFISTCV